MLTISSQRLLCTVIKFHVVKGAKEAKEAVLYLVGRKRKPKTQDLGMKTPLEITYKYLETGISTLDVFLKKQQYLQLYKIWTRVFV